LTTMAERRAQNKYIPPDFDWKKHKSVNDYHKSHPLRGRVSKSGILTVRFELPYHCYCLTCGKMIAMGERFNAEKKRVGEYFSTPIWSFSMSHVTCGGKLEMQTDPKNADYTCMQGLRRREIDTFAEKEALELQPSESHLKQMETDPMYQLEHRVKDEKQAEVKAITLESIEQMNQKHWADPFSNNQALRRKLRAEKEQMRQSNQELETIKSKFGITNIELLPSTASDDTVAKQVFATTTRRPAMQSGIFKSKTKDAKERLKSKVLASVRR
jgi:coiled-coil domain-containing protein 130